MSGHDFEATQEVELSLIGQTRKSLNDNFLIAPAASPIDGIVVGTEFIKRFGHVHVLFAERKREDIGIVIQKKMTVCMAGLLMKAVPRPKKANI